jgi:hypothetical protein
MTVHPDRTIKIEMPSQTLELYARVYERNQDGRLDVYIQYHHPTIDRDRETHRAPYKVSFSQKHFWKELDAYIVQEAMSDLTDNKHIHDWVE